MRDGSANCGRTSAAGRTWIADAKADGLWKNMCATTVRPVDRLPHDVGAPVDETPTNYDNRLRGACGRLGGSCGQHARHPHATSGRLGSVSGTAGQSPRGVPQLRPTPGPATTGGEGSWRAVAVWVAGAVTCGDVRPVTTSVPRRC